MRCFYNTHTNLQTSLYQACKLIWFCKNASNFLKKSPWGFSQQIFFRELFQAFFRLLLLYNRCCRVLNLHYLFRLHNSTSLNQSTVLISFCMLKLLSLFIQSRFVPSDTSISATLPSKKFQHTVGYLIGLSQSCRLVMYVALIFVVTFFAFE